MPLGFVKVKHVEVASIFDHDSLQRRQRLNVLSTLKF